MKDSLNFTAIDFETANWRRTSACSLGIVRVEKGQVVEKFHSYLKPEPFTFNTTHKNIHGISEDLCKDAPTFLDLWPSLIGFFENQIIVAHNAPFDKSVLYSLIEFYNLDVVIADFLDTLYMSKVAYPKNPSYKLPFIYEVATGKSFENHHNALADAEAASELVFKVFEKWNPPSFEGMVKALCEKPLYLREEKAPSEEMQSDLFDFDENDRKGSAFQRRKSKGGYYANYNLNINKLVRDEGFEGKNDLKGKTFAFTGELIAFSRLDAAQLIVNFGGSVGAGITKSTTHLVAGISIYATESNKYRKVKAINEKGGSIVILNENEFLKIVKALTGAV